MCLEAIGSVSQPWMVPQATSCDDAASHSAWITLPAREGTCPGGIAARVARRETVGWDPLGANTTRKQRRRVALG